MTASEPPRDAAPTLDVDRELRAGRPRIDRVRMEAMRARAERALFAVDAPARVGRYVVIDTAGAGGMGIVYRAYDPQLDRRVALKVVRAHGHALEGARERLLREARALAQLAHPNVVPIHDVVMVGDDLVVVMEYVDGVTLEAWARATTRGWPEIVRVFAEAARGLAAAHDVGVVHRDFKPSNALIGTDGRVRVVDFGLARWMAAAPAEGPPGADAPASPHTAVGAVLGTPAYMAPEQLAGEVAGAAADQFSFWVSLHEALLGVRPFAGDDRDALAASIRAGQLAPATSGRAIPAWLRALIVRGLAVDPAARLPSMHRVIGELTRVRGWRRWRVPVVVGALAVIAAVAVVHGQATHDPLAGCDGGAADIAPAWGPVARAQVAAALARDPGAYAREVEGVVLAGLDRYRGAWIDIHRAACVAHRRGAMSAQLLDRSMACLQRRQRELAGATQVLGELDARSVRNAVDVIARLPQVEACRDLASLAADAAPVADPVVRAQIAALHQRLARATALDAAGRASEAIAAARAIASDADRLAQPAVVVDAELLIGRSLLFANESVQALPVLAHAEQVALASGRTAAAITAAARRIFVEATGSDAPERQLAGIERQLAVLEPLSRSVARDPLARPLLLNNLGAVYNAAGRRPDAFRSFTLARAAAQAISDPDPELITIDLNLALLTPDAPARAQLAERAWRRLRGVFGPSHPQALVAAYIFAHALTSPAASLAVISETCDRYQRDHADELETLADCLYYRAFWAAETDQAAEAVTQYRKLAALTAGGAEPSRVIWNALARGELALADRDDRAALASFQRAVDALGPTPAWWLGLYAAHARIGLALAHPAGGPPAAVALLDRAIASLDERIARNEASMPSQLRDRARRLRAAAAPP